jgi:CBS domain-containing protein
MEVPMKTAGDIVAENQREVVCIGADGTVHEALTVMVEKHIGAVVVREDGEYCGIWTERDLMRNTVAEGFDPKTTRMREVMVTELESVPHDTSVYKLLDKFLGLRLRHLLVERDGKYIGLISSGDAIRAELVAKAREREGLNAMVSWDYYEDWGWEKGK